MDLDEVMGVRPPRNIQTYLINSHYKISDNRTCPYSIKKTHQNYFSDNVWIHTWSNFKWDRIISTLCINCSFSNDSWTCRGAVWECEGSPWQHVAWRGAWFWDCSRSPGSRQDSSLHETDRQFWASSRDDAGTSRSYLWLNMHYYVTIKFLKVDCTEKKFIHCNVFNNNWIFRGKKKLHCKRNTVLSSHFLLNLDTEQGCVW